MTCSFSTINYIVHVLPREAMHSAVFAVVRCPSIRLSVCLSRWCIVSKRLNLTSNFFSLFGGPIILGFPHETRLWNYDGVTPAPNRGGVPKICDFQTISHCILETMRDRVSYYETLIGNHRRSIEPCHSRWPWVMLEGHFGDPLSNFLVSLNIFGTEIW